MELFQLFQVFSVQSPCLTSIQETSEDHGLVYLQLCGLAIVVLVQNLHSQSAKSLTHLADSGVYLLVQSSIIGDVAAKIFEIVLLSSVLNLPRYILYLDTTKHAS